ncbi:MAG: hypothetical protein CMJ40_01615 [Phycisphaerae bacterium]|nr:hypothetical protein [Phycisphaerae bacterium]
MSTQEHLDRFNELPRSMQWVILASIALIGFLLWANMIRPTAVSWQEESDQIERNIARLNGSNSIPSDIRQATIGYGDLQLPDRKQQGSLQLAQHVQQLLEEYGIKNDTFTLMQSSPLNASKAVGLTRGNEKIERLKGEVDFSSKPNVAIDIISAMESDSAIDAISSIKLDRESQGNIRVRITIESWVRASKGGRRR